MGEAKRRTRALAAWRSSLTAEEEIAAAIAVAIWERFVVPQRATGMCYRLAYLLTELLWEKDVQARPVVGYVNDGTGDIMSSHAWVELDGKRIDLSLAYTEHPEAQLPGEVLVLDQVIRPGQRYTYHLEQSAAAIAALETLRHHPEWGKLVHAKAAEHAFMAELAVDAEKRRAYLDAAPDRFDLERIRKIVSAPIARN